MEQIPPIAMAAFLEQLNLTSVTASTNYNNAVTLGEEFPSIVITNITNYQMFVSSVGLNMVKPLLELVFHEYNNFQNPWVLANIYRGFGSMHLSLSTVLDLFNELEEGPRVKYIREYTQQYKRNIANNQEAVGNLDAFGAFAGLLMRAIQFVEECFRELGQYKYEYYTKLCHVTLRYYNNNHLQLEFIKHNNICGIGNVYQVKDLSLLASLACCDNEQYVKCIIASQSQKIENRNIIDNRISVVNANYITKDIYANLISKLGIKPVVYDDKELLKGL